MSTPKIVTDGTTAFEEAALNKFIGAGNADKPQVKCWFARVKYNGSAWEVHASTDSAGFTSAQLAWSTNQLQITLANFTNPPVVLVSPVASNTALVPKGHGSSNTLAIVRFYAVADGAHVTTEATTMDCTVLIIGY